MSNPQCHFLHNYCISITFSLIFSPYEIVFIGWSVMDIHELLIKYVTTAFNFKALLQKVSEILFLSEKIDKCIPKINHIGL